MQEAVFVARLSRFLCRVLLSGTPVNVHVPNTGRLLFLREGAKCFLRPAVSPGRKTAWDLFAAEDHGVLVCVDSLMPNRIAERVLTEELARTFPGAKLLREVTIGESRFDFAAKTPDGLFATEVKGRERMPGCSLSCAGVMRRRFPRRRRSTRPLPRPSLPPMPPACARMRSAAGLRRTASFRMSSCP